MKHNKNLCPGLEHRLEMILSYFQRYRNIAYDMQGLKDAGTDVLLRYYVEEEGKFICNQIKSYDDLRRKGVYENLKAQYVDSENKFDIEDYYIILATDEVEDADKIRIIKSDFSKINKVTIISPSQFLYFWELKEAQVGALIKSFVNEGDLLIQRALDCIKRLPKPRYMLIFFMLDQIIRNGFKRSIDLDYLFDSELLENIYNRYLLEHSDDEEYGYFTKSYETNEFDKMLDEDLTSFEDVYFDYDDDRKIASPRFDELKPIIGLIIESQLKYEFNTEQTIDYLEYLILKT